MFILLPWENAQEYDQLVVDLKSEHRPMSRTENDPGRAYGPAHWLRNRTELMQSNCCFPKHPRARPSTSA
jgi:hypothetical protein